MSDTVCMLASYIQRSYAMSIQLPNGNYSIHDGLFESLEKGETRSCRTAHYRKMSRSTCGKGERHLAKELNFHVDNYCIWLMQTGHCYCLQYYTQAPGLPAAHVRSYHRRAMPSLFFKCRHSTIWKRFHRLQLLNLQDVYVLPTYDGLGMLLAA